MNFLPNTYREIKPDKNCGKCRFSALDMIESGYYVTVCNHFSNKKPKNVYDKCVSYEYGICDFFE